MKPLLYDLRIVEIIKVLRTSAREKQANIASVLQLTQPEYCRIERGERALTNGHLHLIAKYLHVPMMHIVLFAELTMHIDFEKSTAALHTLHLYSLAQSHGISDSIGREKCMDLVRNIRAKFGTGTLQESFYTDSLLKTAGLYQ